MRTDNLDDDECIVICQTCMAKLHHDAKTELERRNDIKLRAVGCPTPDECMNRDARRRNGYGYPVYKR